MRAVRYHEHGGPGVLRVDEIPTPDPGHGEIRVAVEAASVNPVDTYFREGAYVPPELPMVPGSDFAGVVDEVGPGVTRFEVGDRVFGTNLGNDRQGTYAAEIVAPANRAAHLPDGVAFSEGAAVALVGATAWRALVSHANLDPAETVLVHGGNGGVGHVAVQLAASSGARVVTTARPTYHDRLAAIGADHVVDYRVDGLADALRAAGPPDVILDHRLDDYLSLDAEVGTRGCRVVGIGNTEAAAGFNDVAGARARELSLDLISVFNTPDVPAVLDRIGDLVAAGDVVPEVSDLYELEEAAAAQRAVAEDSFFGKLVVEP
ncbi:MAG: NADPH:quinone reductase [Halobacteriaceae archaeon]